MSSGQYRGRLAPSPTGYLHIGHARTFWIAQQRAQDAQGILVLRNDDIDAVRAKMAFTEAMLEDLRWLGLRWQEGPDCGGPYGPYGADSLGTTESAGTTRSSRRQSYRTRCREAIKGAEKRHGFYCAIPERIPV